MAVSATARATYGATAKSKTEGTIFCGERCSGGTKLAMARAAAINISWVMAVACTSRAPRKMPGSTSAFVIRLGASVRPVATTAAPAAVAASSVIPGSGTASAKTIGCSAIELTISGVMVFPVENPMSASAPRTASFSVPVISAGFVWRAISTIAQFLLCRR